MDFPCYRDKGSPGQIGTCSESLVSSYLLHFRGASGRFLQLFRTRSTCCDLMVKQVQYSNCIKLL